MHLARILTGSLLCLAVLAPAADAADPRSQSDVAAGRAATLSPANEGRRDFLKWNCYSCHGIDGGGGMGPNIQHPAAGDIQNAVLHGQPGGMPSFAKYATPTDIRNLVAYFATIGTPNEPKWVDWWNPQP